MESTHTKSDAVISRDPRGVSVKVINVTTRPWAATATRQAGAKADDSHSLARWQCDVFALRSFIFGVNRLDITICSRRFTAVPS